MKDEKLELSLHTRIPDDVMEAALLVETWCKKNGWKNWRLRGIADRNLVDELEGNLKKRDTLMEGMLNYDESEIDGE